MTNWSIFIAKDHDGTLFGLIKAKDKEAASAFFMGKYGVVHSIEEIPADFPDSSHPLPVANLIETVEAEVQYFGRTGWTKVRIPRK